jgi:hypothetical protein
MTDPTHPDTHPDAAALAAARAAFESRGQYSSRLLWKRGGSVFAEDIAESDYVDAGVQRDWLLWLEAWRAALAQRPESTSGRAQGAEVEEAKEREAFEAEMLPRWPVMSKPPRIISKGAPNAGQYAHFNWQECWEVWLARAHHPGQVEEWYCETHPEHPMGHDGCAGAGILASSRVGMLVHQKRLLEQEVRETSAFRDDIIRGLEERIKAARQVEEAVRRDAERWRTLAGHWKSAQMRWKREPNIPKSITLVIDFTQAAAEALQIEDFFDAARAKHDGKGGT